VIPRRTWVVALTAVFIVGAATYWVTRSPERLNVLTAGSAKTVSVMDFSSPMGLDPPPAGWNHRTFWTRRAASFSRTQIDGKAALRVATDDSASMLQRFVDIDLVDYPLLSWRWLVEKPIDSAVDERTEVRHACLLPFAILPANGARSRSSGATVFSNVVTSSFLVPFPTTWQMAVWRTSADGMTNA
jgi:hypothetical protein